MSAGISRRDKARAASAPVLATSGARRSGPLASPRRSQRPQALPAIEHHPERAQHAPIEADRRVDHAILGEPRIPWEKGPLRAIMHGYKAGGLTVLNMMISGFSNAIYGRPGRDQNIKTYRNGCVATLGGACCLSSRDLEELLDECGRRADHTTVWRRVRRYAPELETPLRGQLKPTNKNWRVDETCIRSLSRYRLHRCDHRFPAAGAARR